MINRNNLFRLALSFTAGVSMAFALLVVSTGCQSAGKSDSARGTASDASMGASEISSSAPTARDFHERDVSFDHDGFELEGKLLLPGSAGQNREVPAVLLLPGSGPTDMDGNQLPLIKTDLLKQIAEDLARNGVASLRFNKRAVAKYAAAWPKAMPEFAKFLAWENFVGDARRAFEFMRESEFIDIDQCSILGQSEGGVIAAAIASEPSVQVAKLVLMATPGRTLAAVLQSQLDATLDRQGATPEMKKYFLQENIRVVQHIQKTGEVPEDVPAGLKVLFNPSTSKYMQSLLPLRPDVMVGKYSGPVLVVNGDMDSQVSAELDAKKLFAALESRPKKMVENKLVDEAATGLVQFEETASSASTHPVTQSVMQELQIIPGLSHNFKPVKSSAELGFEGQVPPETLKKISVWVQ